MTGRRPLVEYAGPGEIRLDDAGAMAAFRCLVHPKEDDAMTKIMTPSVTKMTDGQINKAIELYRAMLLKHRNELGAESVQQVIGQQEFVGKMIGELRKRAEAVSNLIVRHVRVDRNRSPKQVLDSTGRTQYIDSDMVETMPCGEGKETDIYFFKLGRNVSVAQLEKEYKLRNLKSADPYSLAAVNEADPAFADERPNVTHWQDKNNKWCYIAFDCWQDERHVRVLRKVRIWQGWWFAGLRK